MPLSPVCPRRASLTVACLLAFLVVPAAHAASTLHTGSFVDDDELYSLPLSFATDQTLSARTLSYGGGPDSLGTALAAGGFAPVLALFDATGLLLQNVVGSASTCGSGSGAVDPASGFCWDAVFSAMLVAGEYTLVLSQDGNLPYGPYFADGYSMTGSPDYTGLAWLGIDEQRFINPDMSQRDGHWALEISTQAAAVPEPATASLLAGALVALAAASRRRRPG